MTRRRRPTAEPPARAAAPAAAEGILSVSAERRPPTHAAAARAAAACATVPPLRLARLQSLHARPDTLLESVDAEGRVDAADRSDWVGGELFEGELDEAAWRDQRAVCGELVPQDGELREDEVVDLRAGGPLEVHVPVGCVGHVACGLVDHQRVAVQVHEGRVGEELQQQRDARRVHRRLEEQAAAAAAQRELSKQVEEGGCPAAPGGGGLGAGLLEAEVGPEGGLVRHEGERHVGRCAGGEDRYAELVLLRRVQVERHVVHRPLLAHQASEERLEGLEPEEGGGESDAEGRAVAKRGVVQRHERVEKRRPRARMAQDEDGARVDGLPRDRTAIEQRLDRTQEGVERGDRRHEGDALPVVPPVDVPPPCPEELKPRQQANAADGVVLE
eukprot:CAMPEP_0185447564 /NCGR_PEP_ID=MMETSP1365-20130426/56814_2 /TAXON_ID=38817 /ORGANISM="Gephyrocapsa oceanica, Strain RCC1303" /LENGTH=387 /DNA_ID=CAMNT_0028053465 /DNA_START=75 /DNA_END=1239 /DNA_ORIENTATION=-